MRSRYYLYTLMAAVTLLLSACSKDDSNNGLEEEGEMSNVPITLGSGGYFNFTNLFTKASIDSVHNWVGNEEIGLFGLAVGSTDWTNTNGSLPDCLLSNYVGTITTRKKLTDPTLTDTIIKYDKEPQKLRYYPMSSEKRYSFYGYHPYQVTETGKTAVTTNNITTTYTIDGTQDLLWGKAEAETANGVEGFNAKYFRQSGAKVPRISFGHLLTRLQFFITAGTDGALDDPDYGDIPATDLSVTSIKVLQTKSNPTLTIAGTDAGQLNWSSTVADFSLQNYDTATKTSSVISPQAVTKDPVQIGESIMLQSGVTEYNVEVTVKVTKPTGSQPTDEFKSTLKLTLANNAAFQAGYSHKVTLTVYGLKAVLVSAEVAKWETGEEIPVEVN